MIRQPKGPLFLLLLFFFFFSELPAQDNSETKVENTFYKRQIELHHDNDFLLFTDWFYTTGSFINYRTLLNEQEENRDRRQLTIGVLQIFYTPSNITETNVRLFDRPYAGFSAITTSLALTNERRLLDFTLQMGASGSISGAEGFQSWFHSSNESAEASWIGQIEDAIHINLYARYIRDWKLLDNKFGVHMAWTPTVALGTRDMFIENQAAFYFGRRADIHRTMAYHQIGSIQPEFFFSLKFAYRYVIYDALLEGFITGDSSIFTVDPVDHFFTYGFEGYYRKKRMEYRAGYNYASPRVGTTLLHTWITLSIARNF